MISGGIAAPHRQREVLGDGEFVHEEEVLVDDADAFAVVDRCRCRRVSSPAAIDISVVLPAPFSPTRPTISPGAKSRETSSTAMFAPKRFVMCDRRMKAFHAEARRRGEKP